MSISYQTILEKMELEIKKAKQVTDNEKLYGHMYALKTLAEVIIEGEKGGGESVEITSRLLKSSSYKESPQLTLPSSKSLNMEDGSNGESIFDF